MFWVTVRRQNTLFTSNFASSKPEINFKNSFKRGSDGKLQIKSFSVTLLFSIQRLACNFLVDRLSAYAGRWTSALTLNDEMMRCFNILLIFSLSWAKICIANVKIRENIFYNSDNDFEKNVWIRCAKYFGCAMSQHKEQIYIIFWCIIICPNF